MSGFVRMLDKGFVHLLAASIVLGFAVQAEWAMDHGFKLFDARMFATALLVFLVLQGVRLILLRCIAGDSARLNRQFGEAVLLFAMLSVFLVIENLFLQVVGMLCYTLLVLQHMSRALDIQWAGRVLAGLRQAVTGVFDKAAGRVVRYSVEDDVEAGVLRVTLRADTRAPSVKAFKDSVAGLYQDLPDAGGFKEIRVNVDGVQQPDETLPRYLEPLANYAAMLNIDKVRVVANTEKARELSGLLSAERFEIAGETGK